MGELSADIPGLAFKYEDKIIVSPERAHIKSLEKLPFPNRQKIPVDKYLNAWKNKHGYSSMTINSQRGCSHTCTWCSHAVFGDTYRRRSADNVVEELKMLAKNYHPDRYWFVDDVFTMSKKWLEKFVEVLKKESLDISYECITRADKLDEETIRLLKESGCTLVWIGAESGSQNVLDAMDRRVDVEHVRNMMAMAKANGIETGTFIMLGYPGETEKDIRETIRHLKISNPDHFTINTAYPIKGTKLFDNVESKIENDYEWAETPDNQIDFARDFKAVYYHYAIRKVYNEFWSFKYRQSGNYLNFWKAKFKSMAAELGMRLNR
jgi:radical SAM superfamily enzyme YgiQ (UPF0313 family)